MKDLKELAHCGASDYTTGTDIQNALQFFVEEVKAGRVPNKQILLFVASGIERHLAGKEPWPQKRGRRTDLTECYRCLYEYENLSGKAPKRGDAGRYGVVALRLGIDESTVKRRVKIGRESLKRATGLSRFYYWYVENNLEGARHLFPKSWFTSEGA